MSHKWCLYLVTQLLCTPLVYVYNVGTLLLTLSHSLAHPKGRPAPFQAANHGQRHHGREEEPADKRKDPLPIQEEYHCRANKLDARRWDDPYHLRADDVDACCQEVQSQFWQFFFLSRELDSPRDRGSPPACHGDGGREEGAGGEVALSALLLC